MRNKIVTAAVMVLICTTTARADTFVVTSNADSGPGSLREALLNAAANGTTIPDLIRFNLPDISIAGRTIELLSELPAVTGNLVIDGTDQPGSPIGVSDARVVLLLSRQVSGFSMLSIRNASNVEVYGLFFYQLYSPAGGANYAIYFRQANNLIIGKPQKGNYFIGGNKAITNWNDDALGYTTADTCNLLTIQSNVFGLNLAGDTWERLSTINNIPYMPPQKAIDLRDAHNVLVGGTTAAERNYIYASVAVGYTANYPKGNGFLKISGNYLGVNAGGKVDIGNTTGSVPARIDVQGMPADTRVDIWKNTIGGVITIKGFTSDCSIKANRITSTTLLNKPVTDSKLYEGLINADASANWIMIGGEVAEDGNDISSYNYTYDPTRELTGQFAIRSSFARLPGTGVEIRHNIIHCNTTEGSPIENGQELIQSDPALAWVYVNSQQDPTSSVVNGAALPGSRVDLYVDDECRACEGTRLVASLTVNAAGSWGLNKSAYGLNGETLIATATPAVNKHTFGFSIPYFLWNSTTVGTIRHTTCGLNNGAITEVLSQGRGDFAYEWRYSTDTLFEHSTYFTTAQEVDNLKPGVYWAIGKIGAYCYGKKIRFIVGEKRPKLQNKVVIKDATCGKANGSIRDMEIVDGNYSRFEWRNESGDIVGTDLNLSDVTAGRYRLIAIDTPGKGCTDTSLVFTVQNSGPSIDLSDKQITNTSCSLANGAIKNIRIVGATGTTYLRWEDEQGNMVGNMADLINIKKGKYRLLLKDGSICDTMKTAYFELSDTPFTPLTVTGFKTYNATCNTNNGAVTDIVFSGDASKYSFAWIDSATKNTLATGLALTDKGAGTYLLMATDVNGCTQPVFKATLTKSGKPVIDASSKIVNADQCDLSRGSIAQVSIKGLAGPTSYQWKDNFGNVVGSTQDLSFVRAGIYQLTITDGIACTVTSEKITVPNNSNVPPIPRYNDTIIGINTPAHLHVTNFQAGNYFLFTNGTTTIPIDSSSTGNFITGPLLSGTTYYVEYRNGSCISDRGTANVAVVGDPVVNVPNAFSPNGDGINDVLLFTVNGFFKMEEFAVYTRSGQKVFVTKNANAGWDGRINGRDVPFGTYYYLLTGNNIYNRRLVFSGSVTIFR